MANAAYKTKMFCNAAIRQRITDGYLNATDMCKANKKLYGHWYSLGSTKEYLNELSSDIGIPISELIQIKKGGKSNQQGTWIHPYAATNLAQWLSPKFAVFVSKLVVRYISGDITLIDEIKKNNELLQSQLQTQLIELKEKEDQLNRLHIIQKELLTYKKMISKDETIYIVSTATYARQGIFKIGRTKTAMKFRSSGHNNTHIGGDKVKVLKEFKVNDCVLVERNIHTKLRGLLIDGEKEFVMCPYDLLESIVDLIVNNDDEENDAVNKIVDVVYKLKQSAFNAVNWTQGIPDDIFVETLTIIQGDEKIADLDISAWSEVHKKQFVLTCLKEYIKIQNNINDDQFQIMWKTFQVFLAEQLPVPKSKFKVKEWKPIVKEQADEENLTIKWRV
jgi:hypothetical protein